MVFEQNAAIYSLQIHVTEFMPATNEDRCNTASNDTTWLHSLCLINMAVLLEYLIHYTLLQFFVWLELLHLPSV